MEPKRQRSRRWIVQRKFEPNRLAGEMLSQAYTQLVSLPVRVIEQREQVELRGLSENGKKTGVLVIAGITKKEVI